jgi:glucose-1-phosphate adenylyltransferase
MGNYVFSTEALLDALHADAGNDDSKHDMGGDIVPMLTGQGAAQVYDFQSNEVPGEIPGAERYWRDVGTIDSYFEAHMDLCATVPAFNLYNDRWPILTHIPSNPPAKFVHADPENERVGSAIDSIVSNGVIVSGASVRESVLSPGVHLHSWASVERSVVMDGVDVGRRAVVRNAILDKNVRVAPGVEVGVDKDDDRARGFAVSADGVTVVGKGVEVVK